jgi:hypothetical protein
MSIVTAKRRIEREAGAKAARKASLPPCAIDPVYLEGKT